MVSLAGMAPYDADGLDWFAGMVAVRGGVADAPPSRDAPPRSAYEASGVEYDPEFTPADLAALARRVVLADERGRARRWPPVRAG